MELKKIGAVENEMFPNPIRTSLKAINKSRQQTESKNHPGSIFPVRLASSASRFSFLPANVDWLEKKTWLM